MPPRSSQHASPTPRALALRRGLALFLLAILGGATAVGDGPVHPSDDLPEAFPEALPHGAASRPTDPSLAEKTLGLREALHRDPGLEAPFQSLVRIYRRAGALDALRALYRDHLDRWPGDMNARIVWLRLLVATGQPEAPARLREALKRHPEAALLHELRHRLALKMDEAGALEALARAIEHADHPERRRRWIERLLPMARQRGRPAMVDTHLALLARLAGSAPEARLQVARRMLGHERPEAALELTGKVLAGAPPAETRVTAELLAARAEAAAGDRRAAVARLDALLESLAPDYWRRGEILRRRLAWTGEGQAREALLEAARARAEAQPGNAAAAIELAELLEALDRPEAALDVLRRAAGRLPHDTQIETRLLALYEATGDEAGRADYLAERLAEAPDRQDLGRLYVRSLYLLGRREEAGRAMAALTEAMPPARRLETRIDMARRLRRALALPEAAMLMAEAVAEAPGRLELRRELAELDLLLGRPEAAASRFEDPAPGASIDQLMDATDFLLRQGWDAQAEALLAARHAAEPDRIELALRLAEARAGRGAFDAAHALHTASRALADTPAHYRRWLEAGVRLYEPIDAVAPFFRAEAKRLQAESGGAPAAAAGERLLVFAGALGEHRQGAEAVGMLEASLQRELPKPLRRRLVRRLVELFPPVPEDPDALESHLQWLIEHDPESAPFARARLILLAAERDERHVLRKQVPHLDPAALEEANLLARLLHTFTASGDFPRARRRVLRRLTEVAPSQWIYWEQWFELLTRAGEETRLRRALRRALIGVEGLDLAPETKADLRRRLLASHWRSIRAALEDGRPESLREAMALVDALDRTTGTDPHQLTWASWLRAVVAGRMGAAEAQAEALARMERRAERLAPPGAGERPESEFPADRFLHTPEGALLSLATARALARADFMHLLSQEAEQALARRVPGDAAGPQAAPAALRWALKTRRPVAALVPAGPDRLLVAEQDGSLTAVGARSGKRQWRWEPERAQWWTLDEARAERLLIATPVVNARTGHVFVAGPRTLHAITLRTGALAWRAPLPRTHARHGSVAGVHLAAHGERVTAFDPRQGRLHSFEAATGRRHRVKRVLPPAPRASYLNSGLASHGGHLIPYAAEAAFVEAATGAIAWITPLAQRRPAGRRGGAAPMLFHRPHTWPRGGRPGLWSTGRSPAQRVWLDEGLMTTFLSHANRIDRFATRRFRKIASSNRYISHRGWLLGPTGGGAIILQHNEIQPLNMQTFEWNGDIHLSELQIEQASYEPVGAVVDGPMIHVVTFREAVGYHLLREEVAYRLSLDRLGPLGPGKNQRVNAEYKLRGMRYLKRDSQGHNTFIFMTTAGTAHAGHAYLLPDPWHVVAVGEADDE